MDNQNKPQRHGEHREKTQRFNTYLRKLMRHEEPRTKLGTKNPEPGTKKAASFSGAAFYSGAGSFTCLSFRSLRVKFSGQPALRYHPVLISPAYP